MIENIETRLRELIPSRDQTVFEAARYSLLSEGKRLRPLLTLTAASTFGADPLTVLDPACAIEMIHTYSLIHDDLPCMDDDSLRRGKPTLHKVYGEALALLAGDYLLTFAFEVIANAVALGREQRLQMVKTIAFRAGAFGMIGGQVLDIESDGKEMDEETLLLMHAGKTAALFTACLEVGSLAAGYPPSLLLQSIGSDLGLIYQFQDDLFDAEATTRQKPNVVSLLGLQNTQEKLRKLERSLFQKLQQLPKGGVDLISLTQKILQRSY
jgi:geranylgeranyl diphosphate synthase type II